MWYLDKNAILMYSVKVLGAKRKIFGEEDILIC